jgi:Sec-independent protein translocase protein TatA
MTGIPDLAALIDRLETATEEAREATRDAHSALKEMRKASRELRAEVADAEFAAAKAARQAIDEAVSAQVDEALEEYKATVQAAIGTSSRKVRDTMERLANVCMYGNEQGRGIYVFEELRERAMLARDELPDVGPLPDLRRPPPTSSPPDVATS